MHTPTKLLFAAAILVALGCNDDTGPTGPDKPTGAQFTLSPAQVTAMTARANQLASSNPGNATMRSLVDSTLLALQAGVVMKKLDVQTNLTTAPLYFVGIHRVIHQSNGGSFSTWTLVGIEDPATFANVIQTSGFAQSANSTAPASQSGTIGDGSGTINGRMLQIGANNTLTTFNYSSGVAGFSSDAPSGPCPNGNPEPKTVCTLETMNVSFNFSAAESVASSFLVNASVTGTVAVPTIRLTYTP